EPLAIAAVDAEGFAAWRPDPGTFAAPVHELKYVLRAYDAAGRFDQTAPQVLWLIYGSPAGAGLTPGAGAGAPEAIDPARERELLTGYGESGPLARNIPLDNAGTVTIHGRDVPPGHTVWVAGAPVPVDADGNFVAETVLPTGLHTVEVAVLDEAGNGEVFLRDLEFEKSDWFYMGIADLTVSGGKASGAADLLEGDNAPVDRDSHVDGRLAFYLNGKFAEDWKLTASADTREEPVEDLFSNFMDKSPEALLRRIDPDYYYPTFGDDSTVEETAPTLGKFYVKLAKDESHALWGNFKVQYLDNELAHVDRGLYGANLHYQTLETTRFGEQRLSIDGFGADPGTVPSREEFRGTGGSLYFLRRQDLLVGSERVRVEVRDKDSGLVTGVIQLRYGLDYDIDYFQGRIVLSEPLQSTVNDDLLVRSGGLSGNEAWLVVQYEYTPGLEEIDTLAAGGNAQLWVNDFVKLGVTANRNDQDDTDSSLYAADVTLRASAQSWLKVQAGRSEGLVSSSLRSDDGGFNFAGGGNPGIDESDDAYAYRADLSIGFSDLLAGANGKLNVYAQRLEQGYSAPGQTALTETDHLGGSLELPLTRWLRIAAKADWMIQDEGLETRSQEVDLAYRFADRWSLAAGVRNELRDDDSPLAPATQEAGDRTDAVVQLGYDSQGRWRAYAFGQATVRATDDREDNNRGGVGGAFRIRDWLRLDGEVSHGDLGLAAQVGASVQQSERTNLYLTYALENERALNGAHARMGNLVAGARTRFSDSGSVFVENRYQHASATGLTRAVGMDFAPTDRLTVGANWESGELYDRITHAETQRQAGGARVGYRFDEAAFSSGVEYRFDEIEQPDGSWTDRRTWLFRNNLRLKLTPDWRLLAKFNHAMSDSSQGEFFDGGYTEGVLGYAYRPVDHDRLNALVKYTYFYNVPTTDQRSVVGTPAQFIQKSHIASVDLTYDLFANFTLGGKYAYRLGQVSLDREDPEFFDNDAHLYVLRGDLRFLKNWEASAEGRMLHLPSLDERRTGALVTLYRYLGDHFKVGVGYSFADFSDDLTDLSYDHQGWFFNIVGTL
ncbi:MAG TPA: flagellar motor protein MotB, partial [Myxococcota bacterium]